jgi:hypothetical protein
MKALITAALILLLFTTTSVACDVSMDGGNQGSSAGDSNISVSMSYGSGDSNGGDYNIVCDLRNTGLKWCDEEQKRETTN